MQTVTTIGLDIAKSVFQVHGVDAADQVLIRRQLKRRTVLAFLREAATMPGWHRGLRLVAPLVARAPSAWPYRAPDATSLREALCQTAQERCDRCGGHLRGSHQGEHAVRRDQDARAAELPDTPPRTPFAHPAADVGDQVSREIRRNGGSQAYRANRADRRARERALRPKSLSFGAVQRATMARGAEARAAMVAAADLRLAEAGVLSRRKRTSGHG